MLKKQREIEEDDEDAQFEKLHRRFKKLIKWIEAEEEKSYDGPNEAKLGNYYNSQILAGRAVATEMSQYRKSWPKMRYFDDFDI